MWVETFVDTLQGVWFFGLHSVHKDTCLELSKSTNEQFFVIREDPSDLGGSSTKTVSMAALIGTVDWICKDL